MPTFVPVTVKAQFIEILLPGGGLVRLSAGIQQSLLMDVVRLVSTVLGGVTIMIDLADVRIFVRTAPTNMTYSFDSLMGLAQDVFNQDPTSGHLFLFFSRRRDRVKILFWDRDGFCIWYKRLEVGTFQMLDHY